MKVLKILRRFSKPELNRLSKFVASPYYNINQAIIVLYEELVSKIDEELSFDEFYQLSALREIQGKDLVRTEISLLVSLIEEFMIVEYLKDQGKLKTSLLFKATRRRSMEELDTMIERKINEQLQDIPYTASSDYLEAFNLIAHAIDLQSDANKKNNLQSGSDVFYDKLKKWDAHLLAYFLFEKIKIELMYDNFNKISGRNEMGKFSKLLFSLISKIDLSKDPTLHQFVITHNYLKGDGTNFNVDTITKLIRDASLKELSIDQKSLIEFLANHFSRLINTGDYNANNYFNELYKTLHEYGHLNAIFDTDKYRNVIAVAARIKDYDWALSFAEAYKSYLPKDIRESTYSFSKARVLYYMGEYHKVIETLRNVEYGDLTSTLNSKLTLMFAYYELQEYDALDSFIKSFKVFLRRRRNIPVNRKKAFSDFCVALDHIVKAEDRSDKKRLQKALETLNSNTSIPNRSILFEKIESLEKSIK